ncbi:ATP phosphoribosyltransferase regulatory subunit [Hirschia baltica]|uniref:tRNA synthetase class II (G H P and S) n=1 Tax=Hirschia baltica (strain ATCC 49814 / DSM 5838 / IFAM 1418) TaxID=582402 RepID=C6XQP4_HIRBI|nr:ATP phosphoribosyltransferase regulatory subunit [Hirschia baltica]ACT58650.1 tRNA synthetase class II (G H P and S) [Hirschia baltica ATCC 49814]
MKTKQLIEMASKLETDLANAVSNKNAISIQPANVLPASILLELTGESVRGRLCSFTAPDGEEFCMRPDMTAPIALEIARGNLKAKRYLYSGSVYRFPQAGSGDDIEFDQTGFEWFGEKGGPKEDAEALALTLETLASAGVADGALRFGDSALFYALIDALKLDAPWPQRLRKAFNRKRGPRELMQAAGERAQRSPLASALSALDEDEARAAVEEMFAVSGISAVGGRDAGDIAQRLRSLSQSNGEGPSKKAQTAIEALLDINAPARKAVDEIAKIAKTAGVKLDKALNAYVERLDALEGLGAPMVSDAVFDTEFGRRFDYYDGLVFKVTHSELGGSLPLATGGRYDGLVSGLSGGKISTNAIGVALRADRICSVLNKEGCK